MIRVVLESNLRRMGRVARPVGDPPEDWDGEAGLPHPGYYSGWQWITTDGVLADHPSLAEWVISPATPAPTCRSAGDEEPPHDTRIIRIVTETEAEAEALLLAAITQDEEEPTDGVAG